MDDGLLEYEPTQVVDDGEPRIDGYVITAPLVEPNKVSKRPE